VRGTWEGRGTWQTSGPDLSGIAGPVAIAVVVVAVVEFILSIIVWLAVAAGVVLVLVAAGLIWWLRGKPEREAEVAGLLAARHEALAATVKPQVTYAPVPALEQHVHYHYHAADGRGPARIFTALPGQAGEAITERESS